ncbi:TonB-dependent receptor [Pseudoalteromonas rubra]|uniref:TonB-dependent receptor n=1 Tax=Pseudoalteromonas rubra TaxID=43658 RepID=A0A5S3V1X4_9GAMM|nr:TonB-dependent receptor [Pseudoalteromonas rubra]QPB83943.1 TonB-dependent receptor [Pseudoalteromonas rubra]
MNNRLPSIAHLCASCVLFSSISWADTQPDSDNDVFALSIDELMEVTVEARKVKEDALAIPVSISVMSEQFLRERNVNTLLEAAYFIPNIDITTVGENSGCTHCANITIRGIGQVDPLPTVDPSVGLYLDGVYYARSPGGIFDLYDVRQIEVLRGPQGAIFGKNTIGGAVTIYTHDPIADTFADGEITLGAFERRDVRMRANLELNDSLSSRLTFTHLNRDGFVRRDNGEFEGGQDEWAVSAKFRYQVTPELTTQLSVDQRRINSGSAPSILAAKNDQADLLVLYNDLVTQSGVADPYPPLQIFGSAHQSASRGTNFNTLDQSGALLSVEWQTPKQWQIKSLTAYREFYATYGRDFDNNPAVIGDTQDFQRQFQFSQELNISGSALNDQLSWLVGLFHFDEHINHLTDLVFIGGLYQALENVQGPLDGSPLNNPTSIGGPGNPLNIGLDIDSGFDNEVDIKSTAIYTHAKYALTRHWAFHFGGRLTFEDKMQQVQSDADNAGVILIDRTQQTQGQKNGGPIERSWRVFSPQGGLEYHFNDKHFVYLSASRGFKSGGFNGIPNSPTSAQPFDPEYLKAYELGYKTKLLADTLQLSVAAFDMQHKAMQLRGGQSTDAGLEIFIDNVGETSIRGIEASFKAIPAHDWHLSGNLSYTDAQFDSVGTATQVTTDSTLMRSPRWTAALGLRYHWPIAQQQPVKVSLNWGFRSKTYNDVYNTELGAQGSFALLNARISHAITAQMEVALFVRNLTDKRVLIGGNDFTEVFGVSEHYLALPREWGLSLSYQF